MTAIFGLIALGVMGLFLLWLGFMFVDVVILDEALSDFLEYRWDIHKTKKKEALKKKLRVEGKLKSEAFQQGYRDMGRWYNNGYTYNSDMYQDAYGNTWITKETLRDIAKNSGEKHPQGGRSEEWMAASDQEWIDYYNGGMKFLADLDDMRSKIVDEKRLIEMRKKGVAELDNQTQAAMLELKKLRDKSFENLTEHEKFNREFKSVEKPVKTRRFLGS